MRLRFHYYNTYDASVACIIIIPKRLRFLDVETNFGPRFPVPAVCRILCSNVRGLAGNLSDLTIPLSQYDTLL